MITESTTTEDLIVTFSNARPLNTVSFEDGCTILDAIAMFDERTGNGKLGTWRVYNRTTLSFIPPTNSWDDRNTHHLVCEELARRVVTWTCQQLGSSVLCEGDTFTAWVVIDRATRVTWVECSPVRDQRAQHPRAIREAGEFPSSAQGSVSAHVFLRMGETWREVLNSVGEAYHEAKRLLDGEAA